MKTKLYPCLILSAALAFSAPKAHAQTLIQFWDFNKTAPSGGGGGDSLGNSVTPLKASYTAPSIAPDSGHIIYSRPKAIQAGASTRDSILDNGGPGALIYEYDNNKYSYFTQSDSTGGNNFVRARNPCENAAIYVYIPTTGFKNIQFQYAISASSPKGATYNVLSYSTNGGNTWNNLTKAMDTFNQSGTYRPDTLLMINSVTMSSGWYPVQINFSSDANVNNNANFVVRMMLTGATSIGGSGNDRYDNFAVWGTTVTGVNEISAQAAGYNVYPNPASNLVNVVSQYTGDKVITVYNAIGQTMSVTENKDIETTINTSALNSGVYFVEIKEVSTGNKYTTKLVKE